MLKSGSSWGSPITGEANLLRILSPISPFQSGSSIITEIVLILPAVFSFSLLFLRLMLDNIFLYLKLINNLLINKIPPYSLVFIVNVQYSVFNFNDTVILLKYKLIYLVKMYQLFFPVNIKQSYRVFSFCGVN